MTRHGQFVWSYGITTVLRRLDDGIFQRTLASLQNSGFDKPRLFVDGTTDPSQYGQFGLEVTYHNPVIKTFGNWWLGMWELYIREPRADRFAMFQDDLVCVRNLRRYLEKVSYPRRSYLNLYTFPKNQALVERGKEGTGFFKATQNGLGAVALVFNRDALLSLFREEHHMITRPMTAGRRRFSAIDGGIVSGMNKMGWYEYCHNPSLVQHTGEISTMGGGHQPLAKSFPGEDYDALQLLEPVPKQPVSKGQIPEEDRRTLRDNMPLSENMSVALGIMNLDNEPVRHWLTPERANNESLMIRLEQWAMRVLNGRTGNMEKHLQEIMGQR